jgi:hypothetical protein
VGAAKSGACDFEKDEEKFIRCFLPVLEKISLRSPANK